MVAGGLGQRTCPRSRCAARQCRALAASRLWDPPGAAAEASRRARWRRGLGATPARLFPPLHNGASPAPPSDTRAGRGAKRGKRPKPRGGRRGRDGSSAPPLPTDSSLPAAPQPRGRESSGGVQGLSGVWVAGLSPDRGKGRGEPPTASQFPSFQVSHPTSFFVQNRPCALPPPPLSSLNVMNSHDGVHLNPPLLFPVSRLRHFPPKPPPISALQPTPLTKSHSLFHPLK